MAEHREDHLFGRIALHYKLITQDQLQEVIAQQAREGGRRVLGDLLIERGWATARQIEQVLKVQREYVAKQAAAPPPSSPAAAPAAAPAAVAPAVAPDGHAIDRLLRLGVQRGASDVHVHAQT